MDKQANNWVLKDNAFDDVAITTQGNGTITHDYNSYIVNKPRLGPAAAHDVDVSSMVYAVGPLGVRYQGNTALIDKGSRSAFAAGLFHHTVKSNGPKEGDEPPGTGEPPEKVDIGFHYVAVNGSGQPLDTDGDSTPDYLDADSDGDSMADAWELQYFNTLARDGTGDFDGDGVSDLAECNAGSDRVSRGKVVLIINSTIGSDPGVKTKTDRLVQDLVGDSWRVLTNYAHRGVDTPGRTYFDLPGNPPNPPKTWSPAQWQQYRTTWSQPNVVRERSPPPGR